MNYRLLLAFLALPYFAVMAYVFFRVVRHFLGWFLNSIPPLGKVGPLVEPLTMLFSRYLTKEGVTHRNEFSRWAGVLAVMVAVAVVVGGLLQTGET